jgi:hypothetical protein
MPLRLHAVTTIEGPLTGAPHNVRLIAERELAGAITEQATFTAPPLTDESIVAHREIVDWLFLAGPLLPAPLGVVFRSDDALQKWLGVHYVALSDALAFVEDRVAARVHITRVDTEAAASSTALPGADMAAATEAIRELRRKAVAAVPLRPDSGDGVVVSSAFLVERDMWREFESALPELLGDNTELRLTSSGPWPPYDFVHMQFGG